RKSSMESRAGTDPESLRFSEKGVQAGGATKFVHYEECRTQIYTVGQATITLVCEKIRTQKNFVRPSSRTMTRSLTPAFFASESRSCNGSSIGSCDSRKEP